MTTLNLRKILEPKSIAIIGATDKKGSVGYSLVKNLTEFGLKGISEFGYRGLSESGYKGIVYPVNIHGKEILGLKSYPTVEQIPEPTDLAIIAIPAKFIPEALEQCGKRGILGIIIISAGFKEIGQEGKDLWNKIDQVRKKYDLRIIGPNCLGIINPNINLNATFADKMPKPGNIAFISQSGAVITTTLDWAIYKNIGFSHFISLGSMIDVNFGDLIDYFGEDPDTKSILMYIEGITNAREFISASRHFSKSKPIIVVKAGLYSESAKAAASHTGSLTGENVVYDAAFKRAGIIRVDEIADLFNCAEVLSMQQPLPNGPRLAIITNAGGPGIISADILLARGGKLAKIQKKTIEALDKALPAFWSRGNPIDILGDAKMDRYKAAVEACLVDEEVDGMLLIYSPQGIANPSEIARSVAEVCRSKGNKCKPILTSFMGFGEAEEANRIFNEKGIPTYLTPEQAVKSYMWMYQHKRNLELLYETPEELPINGVAPKRPIEVMMKKVAKENREILTEVESKQLIDYYNIPIAKTLIAKNVEEAAHHAKQLGYPVVLKILSPQIIHKTDAGGVMLNIGSESELREAFEKILKNAKEYNQEADIIGITVQSMIKKSGYEVILGSKTDPLFGPVILFGMGGVGVEIYRDFAIGLPPLNQTLARRMMEETKVYTLLKGYRNMPAANLKLLEEIMVRFSQMLVDLPQIKEADINPLIIDEKEAIALDARIVIDKERVSGGFEPHGNLVISPYPKRYESTWKLRDGQPILFRPIKPEDEPLLLEMLKGCSEESIQKGVSQEISDSPLNLSSRCCNIDYDREISIVAEMDGCGTRRISAVGKIQIDPNTKNGNINLLVASPWQGLGLGSKMIDQLIEIGKDRKLENLTGLIPKNDDNRAVNFMEKMGFEIEHLSGETARATLNLKE